MTLLMCRVFRCRISIYSRSRAANTRVAWWAEIDCTASDARASGHEEIAFLRKIAKRRTFYFIFTFAFLIYNCRGTALKILSNAPYTGRGAQEPWYGQQLCLTYRGLCARRLARAAKGL